MLGEGLFQNLDAAVQKQLFAAGRRRHFTPGTAIFLRGDLGDTMFLIETGRVEVSVSTDTGRKQILTYRGHGEVVGETAVLDQGPRSADVVASTDVTGRIISRAEVRQVLLQHPDAMLYLIGELCAKLRHTMEVVETQAGKAAGQRLAKCLLAIAAKWGETDADGKIVVSQSFSQSDLGDLASLARENVNRHIRTWAAEGMMTFHNGRIEILDPERFDAFANPESGADDAPLEPLV